MSQSYESKILDHLGLVAGMYDELEIGEQIDSRIAQDTEQRKVSVGKAVKAMVLNGLGFIEQRLYLTTQFFETLPTERLLGKGIRPEHLNDDMLGRTLDSLYEYGVTELFRDLAAHSAERLGLTPRFAHLDATSFHVDGEYNSGEDEPEEGLIHVRQGYSRDRRLRLNQVVLDLIVEHQASLPILMEPLSGNASDQTSFPGLIDRHVSQLQNAHGFDYVVADSALYGADHVKKLSGNSIKFITRVPETVGVAQQVIQETDPTCLKQLADGYRTGEHRSEYGDVKQRWLVVHSDEASERAIKQVQKKVAREHQAEAKAFSELICREFACREDAQKALEAFETDLKVSTLSEKRVSRGIRYELENQAPGNQASESQDLAESGECWFVVGTLRPSEAYEAQFLKRRSLFILATNELDERRLSAKEILQGYKGQVRVERGPEVSKGSALSGLRVLPAKREADHGATDGHDALPPGVFGSGMAHSRRASGPRRDVSRPEREFDSDADGKVGLSELPRHPPTACRPGAAGAELARASPAHCNCPRTPIRDSLCFLPHIKRVRKVGNKDSAWRLIGALLAEKHEEWSTGRRYCEDGCLRRVAPRAGPL